MAFRDRFRATFATSDRARAAFVVVLLIASAAFANGVTGYEGTTMAVAEGGTDRPLEERHPVVYPADGVTVVATEGFPDHGVSAGLVAFAPGGQPLYVDTSLDAYLAVEPDPDDESSVRYVGETTEDGQTLHVIERVDLETGTVDRLHAEPAEGIDRNELAGDSDRAAGTSSTADEPRTVQQLPDGGTLAVDTEHNRVLERAEDGAVVWRADIVRPHDAVRLDTELGADSVLGAAAGPDATESPDPSPAGPWDRPLGQYAWTGMEDVGLGWLLNLLPHWVLAEDLPALALLAGSLGFWLLAEGWWKARDRLRR